MGGGFSSGMVGFVRTWFGKTRKDPLFCARLRKPNEIAEPSGLSNDAKFPKRMYEGLDGDLAAIVQIWRRSGVVMPSRYAASICAEDLAAKGCLRLGGEVGLAARSATGWTASRSRVWRIDQLTPLYGSPGWAT
jgi:hypothetical protein